MPQAHGHRLRSAPAAGATRHRRLRFQPRGLSQGGLRDMATVITSYLRAGCVLKKPSDERERLCPTQRAKPLNTARSVVIPT